MSKNACLIVNFNSRFNEDFLIYQSLAFSHLFKDKEIIDKVGFPVLYNPLVLSVFTDFSACKYFEAQNTSDHFYLTFDRGLSTENISLAKSLIQNGKKVFYFSLSDRSCDIAKDKTFKDLINDLNSTSRKSIDDEMLIFNHFLNIYEKIKSYNLMDYNNNGDLTKYRFNKDIIKQTNSLKVDLKKLYGNITFI